MTANVLDDDHGVVDDEANRDSQAAQGHQIEGFATPVQEQKSDGQGRGNGQGRDERGASYGGMRTGSEC